MTDASFLRAHRKAAGLNSKLHAVCAGHGRLLVMLISWDKRARLMLDTLPATSYQLDEKGYDSNGFREAMVKKSITSCIPEAAHLL